LLPNCLRKEGLNILEYEKALFNIIENNSRYVVMTAENLAAIRTLPKLLKDRFIDTGINEQTLIGSAAGLALQGRVPIVHAIAAFLTMRAFEFIRTDIGLAKLPVKLVGSIAGFLSTANGPTHQAIEDIALMSAIPSMRIFCPSDIEDLIIGLQAVIESPFPVYIRLNQQPAKFTHNREFYMGQAETVLNGSDITIFSYGLLVNYAYEAAKILRNKDLSVRLINMRCLKPLDSGAVLSAARETRLLVTVEDHLAFGGMGSQIRDVLFNNNLHLPLLTLALSSCFEPGQLKEVIENEGLDAVGIANKILSLTNQ
jgi:transketolase